MKINYCDVKIDYPLLEGAELGQNQKLDLPTGFLLAASAGVGAFLIIFYGVIATGLIVALVGY